MNCSVTIAPELYSVFGLTLASELPLPELSAAAHRGEADVQLVRGHTPRFEDEAVGLSVHGDGALLLIPQTGRYWMQGGSRMVVEAEPGASETNVRLFLLGSAMAAILHQRGLLPIHANGVVLEGKAVCFMGRSGAGKSTLAAWLHDRGLPLLADDVCVITPDGDGTLWVQPGIPRLRLTQSALEASGRRPGDHAGAYDGHSKYNLGAGGAVAAPAPLSHFYLLAKAEPGEESRIARLQGVAAVSALVANTYRGAYLRLMGRTGPHLAQCAGLAREVPLFEARRPWDLESLGRSAAALERHAREVASG